MTTDPELTDDHPDPSSTRARDLPDARQRSSRPRGGQRTDTKFLISLRLDRDIVESFRAGGPGWQTRLNAALRRAIEGFDR